MYCHHCGQEIPDNSEYCSRCGAPVRRDRGQRDRKADPMELLKHKSTSPEPVAKEQDERNQRMSSSLMMKVALGFVVVVLALSLLSR